jgi:hypothetical protein
MHMMASIAQPRVFAAISLLALLGISVLNPGAAHATILTWTLQDAVFQDGTAATGSFTFDFATNSITDFDIAVRAGADPFTAFQYSPATATPVEVSRQFFSLQTDQALATDPSALRHFDLGFGAFIPGDPGCACSIPLPETGGTIPIFVLAGSREQYGDTFGSAIRFLDHGTVVAPVAAVPEPGTALLILAGMAALGAMRYFAPGD